MYNMWVISSLMITIKMLYVRSSPLKPVEETHEFRTRDGFLSNSDKVFSTVCSHFFVNRKMVLFISLQRSQYKMTDFSSALLQQMQSELGLAVISRHLHKQRRSIRQPLLNTSASVPDKTLITTASLHHELEAKLEENYSTQSKYINSLHERIKTVSLQDTVSAMCTRVRSSEPVYPKMTTFHRLKYKFENFLIIAENETSIIRYFRLSRQYHFMWDSNPKVLIILCTDTSLGNSTKYMTLFQILWNEFKIMDAIVMFASKRHCHYEISEELIIFNPFILRRGSNERGNVNKVNGTDTQSLRRVLMPKFKNFYGYPLRVTMFQRIPTALPLKQCTYEKDIKCTVSYEGLDGILLQTLFKYLNFTPLIQLPSDGGEYGYPTEDGTFTGAIGDIIYRRTDISMNGIFIKAYGSHSIEFTRYVSSDNVCVIVPKSKQIPKWLTIFTILDLEVMFSALGVYLINVCFYVVMKKAHKYQATNFSDVKIDYTKIFLEMFFPFVSTPFTNIPAIYSQRIFIGSCLIFGLVLTTISKVVLIIGMTKPYYYPDINSLEMLDKSDLTILTNSPSLIDTFGLPDSNTSYRDDAHIIMEHLTKKVFTLKTSIDIWDMIASARNVSALVRKGDFQYGGPLEKYVADDGSHLLHVVSECPRNYLLSYLVPRDSPFLPFINTATAKLVESGIVKHWKQFSQLNIDMKQKTYEKSQTQHNGDDPKVFTLADMQLAFYVLAFGLLASFLLFSVEIFYEQKVKRAKERCAKKLVHFDNNILFGHKVNIYRDVVC